jgi:hypothetical protein
VSAFPGFAPRAQYGRNRYGSASPHKLARESGLPGCHAQGVTRGDHGSNGFTDESLRHDYYSVGQKAELRRRGNRSTGMTR